MMLIPIILIWIRIQDLKIFVIDSDLDPGQLTKPDPGKNYMDPDPDHIGII